MDTNTLGIVKCLDNDVVACCNEGAVACLDEGVVELLDNNNNKNFDVDFFLHTPWNSSVGEPWMVNVCSTIFI